MDLYLYLLSAPQTTGSSGAIWPIILYIFFLQTGLPKLIISFHEATHLVSSSSSFGLILIFTRAINEADLAVSFDLTLD